jgi:hypothetical protein
MPLLYAAPPHSMAPVECMLRMDASMISPWQAPQDSRATR